MSEKILAFDLEIATEVEGNDWDQFRPLGITVASIAYTFGNNGIAFETFEAVDPATGKNAERMSPDKAQQIVRYLQTKVAAGYKIISWNGLSFDFRTLGEESGLWGECAALATSKEHTDMMFHFFCAKGFPIGLDAAAKGLGLSGKPEGIDGAKAPQLWREGKYQEVVSYCENDARETIEVYRAAKIKKSGIKGLKIPWETKSGKMSKWETMGEWLNVSDAVRLPQPDNSWMDKPMVRGQFYEWALPYLPKKD